MAHPSGLYFTMREEPGSQANSGRFARLSAIQGGMRQALRNPFSGTSSLYSRSPNPNTTRLAPGSTPPINFGGFFGQQMEERTSYENDSRANLPLNSQPFGQTYSPAVQPSEWARAAPLSQPQPAVLSNASSHETLTGTTTNSTDASRSDDRERRRRRKRRRRHRHHHEGAWVRPHRSGTPPSSVGRSNILHHQQQKGQNIYVTTTVAALFLLATAITYTAIAVSVKGLGQELHILFIITLAGAVIFLAHSLFRLRAARRRIRARQARARANNAANFTPSAPIRVHMARDEEIAAQNDDGSIATEKLTTAKVPPPAYGLWRSSVKVNPQLLFWQRVETSAKAVPTAKRPPVNNTTAGPKQGPRPPSYISDDGVSYVVGAEPRSTVQLQRPPTELHPAYRL